MCGVDCRKYTARIFTSEYSDGNGVVIGNYLITQAHVLEGSSSFEVWVDDKYFRIETSSAIFFQTPKRNESGDFLDLAIYKLDNVVSSIGFYEGDLSEADIICMAWKHSVDVTTNQEIWTPFETVAMFIDRKGNFIECMMSDPIIKDYSRCPSFSDGKLVGTLYVNGDEGRICFFMPGKIIKNIVENKI